MPAVDTPVFDPFSPVYFDDPYELYRRIRDEAPVHHNDTYGFWVLSRFADVEAAHKDWHTFSSSHGVDLYTLSLSPTEVDSYRSLIMMDPPEHDRLRGLVSRVFTPRAVQSFEPMVREVIGGFADRIGPTGSFDAVEDFTALFPVEVICRILGIPAGDRQQIRHWIDLMLHREPGHAGPTKEGLAAGVDGAAYYFSLVADKRRHPADDMTTRLIDAGLDDLEIVSFLSTLGGAGAETVTKLVANAFVLFARHPDQWRKVLDDPSRIPPAVEEVLRYLPPSQYQGRYSMKDSEWYGVTLPAGSPVLLLTGAATRDERVYDRPDVFDIDRLPAYPLGFGIGVHSCLGASLARMEARIAIGEMVRRWPGYEVDEGSARRVSMANVAGYSSVPVRVG